MENVSTIKLEQTKNVYRFIFPDGVIIEKDKTHLIDIDVTKPKIVVLSFTKESDKWYNYILWSNGEIEKMERKTCKCGLPKNKKHFTPAEYEMYITLFNKWVAERKLEYSNDNTFSLKEIMGQFENKKWLDDITYHKFKCVQCNDELIISVNTYRGGGSGFYRNE